MARQYSPKSFLRQAPNYLLERYLTQLGVGRDIPWQHLRPGDWDLVYREIQRASDAIRRQIDRDFREIYKMADDGGSQILLDEGRDPHHRVDLSEKFSQMSGNLERAFYVFLEHPRVFHVAQRFHYADSLGRWEKWQGLPEAEPSTDRAGCDRLAADISAFYSRREGRGHRCQVDHYRRGSRLYWFAYPEDYGESRLVWEEKELKTATQHPAFEVIFVYDEEKRWLDLFARGRAQTKRDLRVVFGRAILGADLTDFDDGVTYELNGLLSRNFQFAVAPEDGIEQVYLRALRIRVMGQGNRRITLEANPKEDPNGVRDMLQAILEAQRIPANLVVADRARLQFVFREEAGRRRRLTVNISHPRTCSLKHDPEDEVVRQLLQRWGIDVSGSAESGARKRRRNTQYVIRG